ncbi:MAG: MmcQ/YjbR family DNA-binding protein [Paludibacteraceae bacterium]|nr:MmcQ/YjbR family DNA-binding protein [Paludibacteraceae bacterium]MBN2788306.1 MmcQ/YjbR family DNA-binding protein [Paludibacteraceae bacterium]
MNHETLREYCLSKKFATEHFPFDDVSLVLKVGGKMFALIPLDEAPSICLKCDPELALELREKYPAVEAAFHFNKKHWNQVAMDGSVSESLVKKWIDHSYNLVYSALTKKVKQGLH